MKISYNWLRGYIAGENFDPEKELAVERVADILTNVGLEVEDVTKYESVKGGLKGLVIGKVNKVEKHPDADRLKLTKVNIGNGEDLQIVCGAPNIAEGQKVIVAPVNTTLYPSSGDAFEIKKAVIRGIESHGMICAEDEIGLGESHAGVMVLPSDAPPGKSAREYFNISEDHILEIGLTPNRADANSHIGVARDLIAFLSANAGLEASLNEPDLNSFKIDDQNLKIEVKVEDILACPRYSGLSLTNIKVADSPLWLKEKLSAIGIRPINNVVDITNFVLHEYGQPLHAFDADKISGKKVIVKKLAGGTIFKALDESERKLDENDLMICDADGGMCMAGVFGGIDSGVTEQTTSIFLESAFFDPVTIRRTATRHNLRTDAATHFEKGVDLNGTVIALKRAALLMQEICGASISSEIIDLYPNPVDPVHIQLDLHYVEKLIGIKIPAAKIVQILHALQFEIIAENETGLEIKVPTFKTEVTRPADVVEEILRIYGINNIEMPGEISASLSIKKENPAYRIQQIASELLSATGFDEIITLSLTNSQYFQKRIKFSEENLVKLYNSLSSELDVLRPTLLASGLEAIAHNHNRRNLDLKFYEFGKAYEKKGSGYSESKHLALFMTGSIFSESWQTKARAVNIFDLKSVINNIFRRLGDIQFETEEIENEILSYGLQYKYDKHILASAGHLDLAILAQFDIKKPVFYADINWDNVIQIATKNEVRVRDIPKFPSVRRDLAMIVDKSTKYSDIESIAFKAAPGLLQEVNLFDVYEDPKLGKEKISYAVSFIFLDRQKTLTDDEVDEVTNRLITEYESKLNALIRK